MSVRIHLTTANTPGAVAIVQMHGQGALDVLRRFTKVAAWPISLVKYADFSGIDAGLAVVLREDCVQLMPHGGPRVVRKMIDALVALGCIYETSPSSRELYPEATSDLEADMLAALAQAASPVAIDLLLNQPANWRRWITSARPLSGRAEGSAQAHPDVLRRSSTLNHLITPPSIVVIGRPNVGKSTLTNRMLGRAASIVADLPGTTRDWVAGLAELPPGIAVRWMDTPGLRVSDDVIEQQAIELANRVIRDAEVVIVMRDPLIDWPDEASLPRRPDVWVMNKIDTISVAGQTAHEGSSRENPLRISAESGADVDALCSVLIERLGLAAIDANEPWTFCDRLQALVRDAKWDALRDYCGR